ncbi:unnamed protein product [Soboliphyme baturini]|uniref:Protein HEXIM1 n=1 Tax=Soboliphyme baturini TaxID=241478 RepID=A0A183J2Z7_9BILA|nr:unnamed protein product [Soboliphyme baturini]
MDTGRQSECTGPAGTAVDSVRVSVTAVAAVRADGRCPPQQSIIDVAAAAVSTAAPSGGDSRDSGEEITMNNDDGEGELRLKRKGDIGEGQDDVSGGGGGDGGDGGCGCGVTRNDQEAAGNDGGGAGKKRRKRRRRARRRRWKPYFKLTVEERRRLEEREERRAERIRAERDDLASVDAIVDTIRQRRATVTTTGDESAGSGGSPAGGKGDSLNSSGTDYSVMEREFDLDYESVYAERLESMTKAELVADYVQLEKELAAVRTELLAKNRYIAELEARLSLDDRQQAAAAAAATAPTPTPTRTVVNGHSAAAAAMAGLPYDGQDDEDHRMNDDDVYEDGKRHLPPANV